MVWLTYNYLYNCKIFSFIVESKIEITVPMLMNMLKMSADSFDVMNWEIERFK
jgi:hypothetical protein